MLTKVLALALFLGVADVTAVRIGDDSEPHGRNMDSARWQEMKISGYNGADEDEIMDNIFSRFSKEGQTPSGHKTGQKLLMKDDAKIAAGTILEAAHKLTPEQVPTYLDANFENSWGHFDQNHEGWIRYEETHTFQRHLQGQLNKFANAPGSITDLSSGGIVYPLVYPLDAEAVPVGKV